MENKKCGASSAFRVAGFRARVRVEGLGVRGLGFRG